MLKRAWVSEWDEKGFARLESDEFPGERIFCHFSVVDAEDPRLAPGQAVEVEWSRPLKSEQDGCRFLALYVRPLPD